MSRSNKKLLVVAAHPDDEVLGCGATVRLKVNKGWRARLLFMTGGVTGRLVGDDIKLSAVEEEQAKLAARLRRRQKSSASSTSPFFLLDKGVDTGNIIDQLKGLHSPRSSDATQIYHESIELGAKILRMFVPHMNKGSAPSIAQDMSKRIVYNKVDWSHWPEDKVKRAKVYPYD